MFDMTGSIEAGMSLILAFTNRIGFFGITLTSLIVLFVGFEWSISVIQKIIKALVPGASFVDSRDEAIDEYEYQASKQLHDEAMERFD